jgi:hypothetical protein
MTEDTLDGATTRATLDSLPKPEKPPINTTYSDPMDRYRDFNQLFKGSDQGKRVLLEMLTWCHMFRVPFPATGAIDPLRLAVAGGEKSIAVKLLAAIDYEPPKNRPNQATRRNPSEDR